MQGSLSLADSLGSHLTLDLPPPPTLPPLPALHLRLPIPNQTSDPDLSQATTSYTASPSHAFTEDFGAAGIDIGTALAGKPASPAHQPRKPATAAAPATAHGSAAAAAAAPASTLSEPSVGCADPDGSAAAAGDAECSSYATGVLQCPESTQGGTGLVPAPQAPAALKSPVPPDLARSVQEARNMYVRT
eukprot:1161670-Pelagomonas_calceolata.AAC.18